MWWRRGRRAEEVSGLLSGLAHALQETDARVLFIDSQSPLIHASPTDRLMTPDLPRLFPLTALPRSPAAHGHYVSSMPSPFFASNPPSLPSPSLRLTLLLYHSLA